MTHPSAISSAKIGNLAKRIDRPLVLIGLMGVGKSTVGRKLASMLGTGFIDVDDEIERAANRSVREIFAAHGEAYFRDGERRVIARLMDESHGVIATGGGAFVDPGTRRLILDRAIAIWLDCDIDTLVERTSRRDSRPLLQTGDPRRILTDLKEARGGHYAEAQIHVVTDNAPHGETALRILEAIDAWL